MAFLAILGGSTGLLHDTLHRGKSPKPVFEATEQELCSTIAFVYLISISGP